MFVENKETAEIKREHSGNLILSPNKRGGGVEWNLL